MNRVMARMKATVKVHRRRLLTVAIVVAATLLPSTAIAEQRTRLATTTSTDNSGLLAMLLPPFEKKYDVKVDVIAVGTGKALKLGENGDVDVVLVHARSAEEEFVNNGFGTNRRNVMYNDFVFVGPADNPAGILKAMNPATALRKIAETEAPFVSRGDDSGTHKREMELWEGAGIKPKGAWYLEAGQGMGSVLMMTDEKQGYTLADRGTWLALKDKLDLKIVLEGDPGLFNPYGIIAVNPARHPHANYMGAMLLIGWFTSPEGQKIIGDFKKHGEALFVPIAAPEPISPPVMESKK